MSEEGNFIILVFKVLGAALLTVLLYDLFFGLPDTEHEGALLYAGKSIEKYISHDYYNYGFVFENYSDKDVDNAFGYTYYPNSYGGVAYTDAVIYSLFPHSETLNGCQMNSNLVKQGQLYYAGVKRKYTYPYYHAGDF